MESADTADLKSAGSNPVPVRVRSAAPKRGQPMRAALSLSKKSIWDFFDCALRARILPDGKIRYPKMPEIGIFGRSLIQFEAGLAPSSSPASLFRQLVLRFLTVSGQPMRAALFLMPLTPTEKRPRRRRRSRLVPRSGVEFGQRRFALAHAGCPLFGAADPNREAAPATAAKPPSAAQRRRVRSAQVCTGPCGLPSF